MSGVNYHHLCERNRGRAIIIRNRRGRAFRGRIERTNQRGVFLRPLDGPGRDPFFFPFASIFSLGFIAGLFL